VAKSLLRQLGGFENQRSFLSTENLCFVIQKLLETDSIATDVYQLADSEHLSTRYDFGYKSSI
jgi:hypothetical protein